MVTVFTSLPRAVRRCDYDDLHYDYDYHHHHLGPNCELNTICDCNVDRFFVSFFIFYFLFFLI